MATIDSKGMHKVPHSKEMQARRKAKNARNETRHPGESFGAGHSNTFVHHIPCSGYPTCNHRKHGAKK